MGNALETIVVFKIGRKNQNLHSAAFGGEDEEITCFGIKTQVTG
jgi:hypothetical protein